MYNLLASDCGKYPNDYIPAIKALRAWANENLGHSSLKAAKDFVDAIRDDLRSEKTYKIEQFIRENGLQAVDVVVARMKDEEYKRQHPDYIPY